MLNLYLHNLHSKGMEYVNVNVVFFLLITKKTFKAKQRNINLTTSVSDFDPSDCLHSTNKTGRKDRT